MLWGRASESARLDGLFADAAAGRGGVVVVRGEPGVGKSALLSDASSRAPGAQVLWTQGIESESPLAFAALHRLLRPVLPHLDRLPAPQARALRGAFGEQDGSAVDRLVVFVATLSLLSEAAEERPIIAIVDDAQWLDAASAEALLFVARRLLADRVALVFGAREGDVRTFHGDGLPELALGGLDSASAGGLLTEQAGAPVSAEVCAALVAQTGGSPLALTELLTVLSSDQLAGKARLPDPLPLTLGVERAFLDRARRLPAETQTLLLVAAADGSGQIAAVRRAAAALGVGAEALEAAERSGLIRVRGLELRFRHPLVRSAYMGRRPWLSSSGYTRSSRKASPVILTGGRGIWPWHRRALMMAWRPTWMRSPDARSAGAATRLPARRGSAPPNSPRKPRPAPGGCRMRR